MRRTAAERLATPALIALLAGLGASVYFVSRTPPAAAPPVSHQVEAIAQTPISMPVLTEDDLSVVWRGIDPLPARVTPAPPQPAPDKRSTGTKAPFPLKVRGIIFSDDAHSVAFLESGKQMILCRAGATVGGWSVAHVDKYSVTIRKGEEVRVLTVEHPGFDAMPVDRPGGGRRGAGHRPRATAPARPGLSSPRTSRERGRPTPAGVVSARREEETVRPTKPPPTDADVTIAVRKEDVDLARSTPMAAVRGLAFEPIMQAGGMEGILLRTIPKGSLAARYGFAPGDRIIAVNGEVIDSPQRMFQLYRRYQHSDAVRITIERGGKRRDILYYAH